MQIISLFIFILFSITLLSESYYYARAIGVDSASHGLLYGERVVRRYSDLERYRLRLRGLQERAEPDNAKAKGDVNPPKAKADDNPPPKAVKGAKDNNNNNGPNDNNGPNNNNGPDNNGDNNNGKANNDPAPKAKAKDVKVPDDPNPPKKQPDNTIKTPQPPQPPPPPQPPQTNDTKNTKDTKDNKDNNAVNPLTNQVPPESASAPTVSTGTLSGPGIAAIATVGGVFVLVGGLFAVSKRRKNKEMTKNILATSAKAWEQQDSTYEVMKEETKPIGSYIVKESYTPTLSDELDIQPGDKVTILVEFDDGWVQGINETRGGAKGVFPRYCVDMSRTAFNANNKRSSSMGGYTEVDLNN